MKEVNLRECNETMPEYKIIKSGFLLVGIRKGTEKIYLKTTNEMRTICCVYDTTTQAFDLYSVSRKKLNLIESTTFSDEAFQNAVSKLEKIIK